MSAHCPTTCHHLPWIGPAISRVITDAWAYQTGLSCGKVLAKQRLGFWGRGHRYYRGGCAGKRARTSFGKERIGAHTDADTHVSVL